LGVVARVTVTRPRKLSALSPEIIGEAAVANGIQRIVTWNVSHMGSLFPDLDVRTPGEVADLR